jgi:DnaJ like chaperone protein
MGVLIGALIGWFALHGLLGAVIGGALGWLLTSGVRQRHVPRGDFVGPRVAVLGAVAKADGHVSAAEIAIAERRMASMNLNAEQRRHAIDSFNAGKQPGFDASVPIAQLRAWSGGRRDHAFPILDVVVETVLAEGPSAPKLKLLRELAWGLRVSEMELMALMAMKGYAWTPPGGGRAHGQWQGGGYTPPQRRTQGPDPYAVLGVARSADDREIKRAYRKLMSEHHPDRLGDLPEDLRRRAEQRASEINAAYDRIKSERGFK